MNLSLTNPQNAFLSRLIPNFNPQIFYFFILALITLGWIRLVNKKTFAKNLFPLWGAGILCYSFARLLYPHLYFPERYLVYTIPILALVMLVACAVPFREAVSRFFKVKGQNVKSVSNGIFCLCLLILIGGWGKTAAGYTVDIKENAPLYDAIRQKVPKDAYIAGWPTGPMENVTYFSERKALVSYETHLPFHQKYISKMRKRMKSVISAYLSLSPSELRNLRENFNVSHLLINENHYGKVFPLYFEPFNDWSYDLYQKNQKKLPEALEQIKRISAFTHENYRLLDLRKL